jgi:hypothetical protein
VNVPIVTVALATVITAAEVALIKTIGELKIVFAVVREI